MATEFFPNSIGFLSAVNIAGTLSATAFESSDSPKWNSVYSNVQSNSATYATIDFTNSKFFPLSGGDINGSLTVSQYISSSDVVYSNNSNSNQWKDAFTTIQANSATWMATINYIRKFDYIPDGIDYSYSGVAVEGTLETDSLWKVTRLSFTDSGALSSSGIAQNITWTERLTATYV